MKEIDMLDKIYKIKSTMTYLNISTDNIIFAGEIPEESDEKRKLFNKNKSNNYPIAYLANRNCNPKKFKKMILMETWFMSTIIDIENVYGTSRKIILCFTNINEQRHFYGTTFEAMEWMLSNKTNGCLTIIIEP
jgi:hypothetical protein